MKHSKGIKKMRILKKLLASLKAVIKAVKEDYADIQQYGLIGKNFKGGDKK